MNRLLLPEISVWLPSLLALLLGALVSSQTIGEKVLLCHYDSTSYWREGSGKFQASDIDPALCTHILYSFIGIKENSSRIYSKDPGLDLGPGEIEPDPDDEINFQGDLDMIRKTVKHRELNPKLKILLSVGGPNQAAERFPIMAKDSTRRLQFIESTIEYLERFDLDGIDIFWANPEESDKPNLVLLMKELSEAFTNVSTTTGKDYVLTLSLGCTRGIVEAGYEIPSLTPYTDYFNILCFDLKMFSNETDSGKEIGHHSPLRRKSSDPSQDKELSVDFAINYFLGLGAPSEKLVLGVASHARTYTLESPSLNNFYDIAKGPGPKGEFTLTEGLLAYFEICDMIMKAAGGWLFRYDYDYGIPYVSKGTLWIGYENEISVKEKVDFAMTRNLGGLILRVDLDDYRNTCGAWFPFPLTASVKDRLGFWNKQKTSRPSSIYEN